MAVAVRSHRSFSLGADLEFRSYLMVHLHFDQPTLVQAYPGKGQEGVARLNVQTSESGALMLFVLDLTLPGLHRPRSRLIS